MVCQQYLRETESIIGKRCGILLTLSSLFAPKTDVATPRGIKVCFKLRSLNNMIIRWWNNVFRALRDDWFTLLFLLSLRLAQSIFQLSYVNSICRLKHTALPFVALGRPDHSNVDIPGVPDQPMLRPLVGSQAIMGATCQCRAGHWAGRLPLY